MAFFPLKKFLPSDVQKMLETEPEATFICGIDEVGRGCWAGPLVACALILKTDFTYKGLTDSKGLNAAQREDVFKILQKKSIYAIGIAEVAEVDFLGVIKANNLAFNRALEKLKLKPKFLVIDGRDKLQMPYPFSTIIKGDKKLKVIACASIVAKVTRDRLMQKLAKKYPNYGFEVHKGYGTKRHQQAINDHGISAIHRKRYKPVFAALQSNMGF